MNYFNINYTGRVTLHHGNFSLLIRDLQGEDTGEYEVNFGSSSGGETQARVRLEVTMSETAALVPGYTGS